ncbi:hypothetical protein L1887_25606 [Cichorium endivia]|nr:hypothetical protein L1887_25606 [Cichorium endivia]
MDYIRSNVETIISYDLEAETYELKFTSRLCIDNAKTHRPKVISRIGNREIEYRIEIDLNPCLVSENILLDEGSYDHLSMDRTDWDLFAAGFKNKIKRQGNFSSEKPKEDNFRKRKSREKVIGDSCYNCHYCKGKNHFAKDCLLGKQNEKKEQVKNKAYYAQKIKDLKKKEASIAKPTFVVQEVDENGIVEVWSMDSEDEEVQECEAVVNKVRFILKSLNVCSSIYDKELDDLRVTLKNEERIMKIDLLELELVRARDDIIYDEIDADCYKCETIVSSDEVSEAYRIGLDKIENYIQSKEHKSMVKEYLSENDKDEIKSATLQKFQSLCKKFNSEYTHTCENIFEFDESEMSEISVEDKIDCSAFVTKQTEPKKNIISENSVAFARIVENKGSQVLNEQATVFPNVKTVPNQLFVKPRLNLKDTLELKVLVDNNNSDGCDAFFWSEPIDNADEMKSLSEMTSWSSRGKYISGSLNRKDSFSQPGTSGTKPILNAPFVPHNSMPTILSNVPRIHKSPEELIARRRQMNAWEKGRIKGVLFATKWWKIRYGNNVTGEIKGYGIISNGEFSIHKVAYVEGLQHNLISVSQLVVGSGLKVSFDEDGLEIVEKKTKTIILKSKRKGEMFPLDMKRIKGKPSICLLTQATNDDSWLWHRRLSHMNFRDINKLVLSDLVRGLPLLNFDKDHLCDACELGKQSRKSHSMIINTKIVEPLELLHIDLCDPSAIESVAHNKYILVVVDDFSCFMWVFFFKQKSEATSNMINFIKQPELLL